MIYVNQSTREFFTHMKIWIMKSFNHRKAPGQVIIALVPQTEGWTVFCVDYRKLNEVTNKNAYSLFTVDNCLAVLSISVLWTWTWIAMTKERKVKQPFLLAMVFFTFVEQQTETVDQIIILIVSYKRCVFFL